MGSFFIGLGESSKVQFRNQTAFQHAVVFNLLMKVDRGQLSGLN